MPVITVGRDKLFAALGRTYTEEEFQDLCFQYGIELDDVTTEKEMQRKELQRAPDDATAEATADGGEEVLFKIDIPANRYDMLCLEGIARALNIFNRRIRRVDYRLADMTGRQRVRLTVKPETALVRPFVVAAVLRGVTFDPTRYASFIDLQDKLHQNLCRQRSLVAIGTHDLGKLVPPFTYEALPPADIEFVPLKQTRSFRADELMQHYEEKDLKLRRFVPIIRDSVVYPVIMDSRRTVCSLPPIINAAMPAITLDTRDVFIECTATDLAKANIVVNTVATMFSEYCSTPFEVEPVEVVDALGESQMYPRLSSRETEVGVRQACGYIGIELDAAQIAGLLDRMALTAETAADGSTVRVQVPPTRSDVLHACDVFEDVAIAYGYNNVPWTVPPTVTVGKELPLNQLCELLRGECAMAGYTEVLTWALCSRAENYNNLRRPDDGASAVAIGNPATAEFQVCRTTLLAGLLKTLGANKNAPLPVRLFEISDVVLLSDAAETGARNERRLAAAVCAKENTFETIHGFLNRVMDVLGVPAHVPGLEVDEDPVAAGRQSQRLGGRYEWQPSDDVTFFPGRQARIHWHGAEVGVFGIVHPEVLGNFEVPYPVAALELNLEPFLSDQFGRSLPTHMAELQIASDAS